MHHSTWFDFIPVLKDLHIPWWLSMAVFVLLIFILLAVAAKMVTRYREEKLYPDKGFSLRNILEVCVELFLGLINSVIGERGREFFPVLATLFFFILVSNILGLIPGFLPPTSYLTVNLSCALLVFIYYNYVGFKEHGVGYLKQFAGPVIYIAPLMFVIELIGHCVRPISLSLRLFGNINADHTLVGIISELVPLGAPIAFLALGLFVSFLQAFIFTMLSMVYISMAISHDH